MPACSDEGSPLQGPKCTWGQTTSALLSLQLGWGLWLFPAAYARLGWIPGIGITLLMALTSVYSGTLFTRLYMAVPEAVLLGDIGKAARGEVGRTLVYCVIYSLDATRCIILQLAATQSLSHALGAAAPAMWQCGLVVVLLAGLLSQVRALSRLSSFFLLGTVSQLAAIGIVLYEMLRSPSPDAVTQLAGDSSEHGTFHEGFVAAFSIIFAFGGQFAFCELLADMKAPLLFPKAISVCTAIMAPLYILVGATGYWSRGNSVTDIVIFSLGESLQARIAAGLILVQALSQYLVNLNVWSHNLLVLTARTYRKAAAATAGSSPDAKPGPGSAVGSALAQSANARSAAEHQPLHWLAASGFVVAYSYAVSNMIPYFSCMVGIVSSSTYLVCAYTLPCWFAVKLLHGSMARAEVVLDYALLGLSLPLSLLGLSSSVTSLVRNLGCKNCRFEPWALQAVFLMWLFVMLNVIGFRYKRVAKQQLNRQCWMPLLEKSRNSTDSSSNSNLVGS
ncbi:hypothetical protein OEZ86_007730 [Tetradesmus obliquus]|nr:hypothetical protein OEZ86_007730 [Tetradesmus obliquus]